MGRTTEQRSRAASAALGFDRDILVRGFLVPTDDLLDPVLLVSREGAVLAANQAAMDAFGLADARPPMLADLVVDLPGRGADWLARHFDGGDSLSEVLTFRTPRGDVAYLCSGGRLFAREDEDRAAIHLYCRLRGASSHGPSMLAEKVEQLAWEIAARKRTEAQLRDSQERLTSALLASETGTFRWNVQEDLLEWDESLKRIFGLPPEASVRRMEDFLRFVHPEDRSALLSEVQQAIRERRDFGKEFRIVHPDGSIRWIADKARSLYDADGRPLYLTGACRDVTDQKEADEHQRLLMAELNHRVKNSLAVVQAMAAQTLRRASSLEGFAESFSGRLRALSEAHGLLTEANWRSASLEKLVRRALKAHGTNMRAVEVGGPDLSLPPKHTLGMGLVLHELATNAAKYGALSVPSGRVVVRWTQQNSDGRALLRLEWIETGGPRVEEPVSRGFGMNLIERTVAHDLDGSARLTFCPEGLRCEIVLPSDKAPAAAA